MFNSSEPSLRGRPSSKRSAATTLALLLCASSCWLGGSSCGSSGSTSGTGGRGSSSGGATASGGATGTGGVSSSGGAAATGGAVGTGGDLSGTGGVSGTGGASASGGASGIGVAGGGVAGAGTGGGNTGGVGGGAGTAGRGPAGAGGGGGQTSGFLLTSPTLTEGGMFPPELTCAGADRSPEFDWTAGPAGTLSYALVLTDMANNLVHWVVWDIPPETRSLSAMLATTAMLATPAGARQLATGGGTAYTGPCPNGNVHTYEFDLHAVDAAMLPGVATNATTTQVKATVMMHSLAKTSLSAQSNAKRP